MKPFFPFLLLLFFALSCADEVPSDRIRRAPSGGVFADYQVWAEEGTDDVTIRLQYRRGDEEGEAFAVQGPGKVLLDGEELTADSTRFMGAFYEVLKPVESFRGEHTVVYIDKNGKEHRETFMFKPFTLADELPETIKKRPFRIQLKGFLQEATPVRLVMVDTSLHSSGVNEELLVEGGMLEITEEYLSNLTKGPVTLEIYREEERPVKESESHYGKFIMNYGLRRQFNLVE